MPARRFSSWHRQIDKTQHATVIVACFVLSALMGVNWALYPHAIIEIEHSFGWSRLESSTAFSLFMLGHALSTPLLSRALSSGASRWVLVALALLLAIGMIGAAVAGNPWVFYVMFGPFAGAGTQAFGSYVVFSVVSQMRIRKPATVMAFVDSGAGVGPFLGLPFLALMLEAWGWRATFAVVGFLLGLVGVVVHVAFMPPIEVKSVANRAGPQARIPKAVLVLAASTLLGTLALQGVQSQQVAALQAHGFENSEAVYAIALSWLLMTAWRLASGVGLDRWGAPRIMTIVAIAATVFFAAIAGMTRAPQAFWLPVYALGLAIGFGAQGIIAAATLRSNAMAGAFPTQFSLIRTAAGVGLVIGPMASGAIVQYGGGYTPLFKVLAVFTLMHVATYWLAAKCFDSS